MNRYNILESINVRLKDIILDTTYPYVILTGKGDKTRVVPLTNELIDNFQHYISIFHKIKDTNNYLFYTKIHGVYGKISTDNIQGITNKYGNIASKIDSRITNVHPHLLRHSFGALMYRNGLSLPEVAKLMGQDDWKTTEIYAETDIDMIDEAFNKGIQITSNENKFDNLSEDDKLRVLGLKK